MNTPFLSHSKPKSIELASMSKSNLQGILVQKSNMCLLYLLSFPNCLPMCSCDVDDSFYSDVLLTTSPDLCGGGQPADNGGGDVLVTGMRTGTGAGGKPILFYANRGAAMGAGSGGIAGWARGGRG
jgi:hypothetical protein